MKDLKGVEMVETQCMFCGGPILEDRVNFILYHKIPECAEFTALCTALGGESCGYARIEPTDRQEMN